MAVTKTRVPTPNDYDKRENAQNRPVPTPTTQNTNVPSPPGYTPPNYRSQVDTLLGQLRDQVNTPFTYNPQDDPRFQAHQQLARQQAAIASRNAMERMNERGILHSSLTGSQLAQIQQQAEQQALAYLPQYYDQAYRQRQTELENLRNLANMYAQQDDTMFNRGVTEAQLTGRYIPENAKPILEQIFKLKEQGDIPGQSPEYYQNLKAQADVLRNQLRMMGIDPSFIEYDRTGAQAWSDLPNAFTTAAERERQYNRDMAEREFEYRAARDAIKDQQWKMQFDEDVRRFGLDYALQRQVQLGNLDIARYNAQTSRMNAQTSRMNAETSRMEAQRRQEQYEQSLNQPQETTIRPTDYKTNPDFARDYQYVLRNPNEARRMLENNAAAFIEAYGYDGYRALLNALPQDPLFNFQLPQ